MEAARNDDDGGTRVEVGVAELRAHLSRYLAQVRQGVEVVVTDHGHPIAHIAARRRTTLDDLIAQGRARPPMRRTRPNIKPVEYGGTLDDITRAIQSQRR